MAWLRALENRRKRSLPGKTRRDEFERATPLELRIFRVEEGEAILLTFSGGRTWLVDGGNTSNPGGNKRLAKALQTYLERNNLILEVCVASHSHFDHIGAYRHLFNSGSQALSFPIKVYRGVAEWGRKADFLKEVYHPFVRTHPNLVDEQIIDPKIEGRRTVKIGPGVRAHLYVAEGNDVYNSLMMLLEYHKARILFTGDLNSIDERRLLRHFKDNLEELFPAHVLKITHHGSDNASSTAFIKAVKPAFAIVSDTPSDEGHRLEDDTKARVLKTPVGERQIYQTEDRGDVVVETDGAEYKDGILYRVRIDKPGKLNSGLKKKN